MKKNKYYSRDGAKYKPIKKPIVYVPTRKELIEQIKNVINTYSIPSVMFGILDKEDIIFLTVDYVYIVNSKNVYTISSNNYRRNVTLIPLRNLDYVLTDTFFELLENDFNTLLILITNIYEEEYYKLI